MSRVRLSIREKAFSLPPDLEQNPWLEKWQDPDGRESGFAWKENSRYFIRLYGVGVFSVRCGGWEAVGFTEEGVGLRHFRDVFFRVIAPWILQRQHWECLHASAVLTTAGVVAFCGRSGHGKSTLACAFCGRGHSPYADDAVPVLIQDGAPMAARIPHQLRLRGPAAAWFRDTVVLPASVATGPEVVCDLQPSLRPLAAVYSLQPLSEAASQPFVERLTAVESFHALLNEAYSLTLTDRQCNRKMVENYMALARAVPVFRLSVPFGLENLPAVLDLLEQKQQELQPV